MICQQQILNFTGAPRRAIYGYSDIYYIPRVKASDFIKIASVFFQHGTFLEVAVSSTLLCISNGTKPIMLPGITQANSKERLLPWMNIDNLYNDRKLVFYHATKWRSALYDSRYVEIYHEAVLSLHKCGK